MPCAMRAGNLRARQQHRRKLARDPTGVLPRLRNTLT